MSARDRPDEAAGGAHGPSRPGRVVAGFGRRVLVEDEALTRELPGTLAKDLVLCRRASLSGAIMPALLRSPMQRMAHAHDSPTQADNLIWIDLEMTGLMPERDRIIEIATVVTNKDLELLAEGPVLALSLIHISEPTRPPVASRMPSSA